MMKKLTLTLLAMVLLSANVLVSKGQTVVDIIVGSTDHTILEAAVIAAELDDDLSGTGPFTVFAPTDAAFGLLPDGLVDDLLLDPSGDLADILLYHVVGESITAGDLSDGLMKTTLNGKEITITKDGSNWLVNDVLISQADIHGTNGVVHVIDAVLIPPTITVVDIIVNSPNHETLEAAVIAAELADDLSDVEGTFTVFAPTDAAFDALPEGLVDTLLADPTGKLADILLYHVLGSKVMSEDLSDGIMAETLLGFNIEVRIDGDDFYINDAIVTADNLEADNGVVHVINAVLLPPTVVDIIVKSPDHGTLEAAVLAAGLEVALSGDGPFTVFAPTDDAFDALPTGVVDDLLADPMGDLTDILLHHVLGSEVMSGDLSDGMMAETLFERNIKVSISGDTVYIDDAMVTFADIEAYNGVVHVIDAVLIPPTTVFDIVSGSDDHATLEAAILAAELDGALNGEGPFTLFAPTDDAFDALPAGVVGDLLADPMGDLSDILLYHVLGSEVMSGDLSDGMMAETLFERNIKVTISNDTVYINNAMVTLADIEADNGVVHVIDAVLLPPTTVFDIISGSEDHGTLEAAILAAELDGALNGEGPFTVFAPTDDAFAALPAGLVDDLLADPTGDLTDILLYHVVAGKVMSGDLSDGMMAETLNGKDIKVSISGDTVYINDAMVSFADIEADNGVVHVIDAVLIPPTITVVDIIVNSPDHGTLEAAVIAAELADDLSAEGPFTVFAPTDAAFDALPEGVLDELLADPTGELANILLYHVVAGKVMSGDLSDGMMAETLNGKDIKVSISGDTVYINDAIVIAANIEADNGVVHVIDAVLLPPTNTVVDIIVNSPDHGTLETAVIAAGLDDDLSGDGPFTVFAPTDDAFAALPAGVLDALLADPTGALADVLLYHVIASKVLSGDLSNGMMVETLQGQEIEVKIDGDKVYINEAEVTMVDLEADNGVVHVIDAVLVPESDEPTAINQQSANDFGLSIYPNPAQNYFTLNSKSTELEGFKMNLINSAGQVIKNVELNGYNTSIDVSDINSGVYYIQINTGETLITEQIVVQ